MLCDFALFFLCNQQHQQKCHSCSPADPDRDICPCMQAPLTALQLPYHKQQVLDTMVTAHQVRLGHRPCIALANALHRPLLYSLFNLTSQLTSGHVVSRYLLTSIALLLMMVYVFACYGTCACSLNRTPLIHLVVLKLAINLPGVCTHSILFLTAHMYTDSLLHSTYSTFFLHQSSKHTMRKGSSLCTGLCKQRIPISCSSWEQHCISRSMS